MNQKIILRQNNQEQKKHTSENNCDFIDKKKSNNIITAVGKPKYFCIGIVDIVNSTKTVAQLQPNKVPKYYEIFLNNMAKTVYYHQGEILKIMGDSLLFYFPDTCHSDHKLGFLNTIECGFSMMKMHEKLNEILKRYALPKIDFRISFDYGNVTMMKTRNGLIDLVGPTINTCAKINDLASINGTVIGRDLYEKIKHIHEYGFRNAGNFSIGLKQPYPIFTLYKKTNNLLLTHDGNC